eukprot:8123313-Pyramimonas_sp.AAC.1
MTTRDRSFAPRSAGLASPGVLWTLISWVARFSCARERRVQMTGPMPCRPRPAPRRCPRAPPRRREQRRAEI